MLVHRESKNLILNLRDPARVTDVIPTAKLLKHGGANIVVVPHQEDEVRVLRNLGLDAPAPIDTYYEWPCIYPNGPFAHQRITAAMLALHPRAYCLNGLGSGKTLSALWAYDYLRSIKRARRLLVIGPLSTLQRTWSDEVFTHFPHLTCAVLHGTAERRVKLINEDFDVYVINHDGIRSKPVIEALKARDDIDVVVIDELAVYRTSGTERFKAVDAVIKGKTYVWGMTGTPIPNAPTDAWAQCRLITPHTVPKFFGQFRDAVMRQLGPYKWVARDNALATVHTAMQPAVRFSREECIDLPPTTYQTREVALTKEQKQAFDDMMRKLKAEYEGGQVLAVNEAVKLGKLVQICTGVAYGANGTEITLPCQPRVDEVLSIIEEAEAKVIVFVPYTSALHHLAQELAKTYTVAVVDGSTPKGQRDQIFGDFQKRKDPHVLVANAGAMSHGLTLTAANVIVWYGPTTSNDIWNQANARIVRPGQKLNTLIVHIESTPVERAIYDRLRKRTSVQGALLDMFKGGR